MLRRAVACTLLPWYLAGCVTWRVQNLTPQQVVDSLHPARVRVTVDSTDFVLEHPSIAASDSLVGLLHRRPTSVALSRVSHVAIERPDAGGTIALISVFMVIVLAVANAQLSWTLNPGGGGPGW